MSLPAPATLHERAFEQMVVGVATRRYDRSLEAVPDGVQVRGTSKSAVSRRFVSATRAKLASWIARGLGDIDLAVVMIDGVHFAEHVVLVALGIDASGAKHVLGLWEGATENAAACTALLGNLRERGIRSLREGLDETLTVMRLELPRTLERTLSTTNAIENLMGRARSVTRNVKRWRGGEMILRWMAAAASEAEKGFRRLKGHAGVPKLVTALRERDARIEAGEKEIDGKETAA